MTSRDRPRIVILGAGLSGLVLATLLDGVAADVILVEQDLPPGRPGVFHGLVTGDDLAALSLQPGDLAAIPVAEVDHASSGSVPVQSWWACEHRRLLAALWSRLEDRGVRIVPNRGVVDLVWREGTVGGIRLRDSGEVVESDLLVFADESDPRTVEQVGLRPAWLPTQIMHLGKERFAASPDLVRDRFGVENGAVRAIAFRETASWGVRGWVVVIPGPESVTVKAAILLEDEMASARHVREYLDEQKSGGVLTAALAGLTPESFFTEVVPVGGYDHRPKFHADGVIVLNDLLGLTHPLNRDGCSTTIPLCRLAVRVIGEAIRQGDFTVRALDAWSSGLRDQVIEPVSRRQRSDRAVRHLAPWEWASLPQLLPEMTDSHNSAKLVPRTGPVRRLFAIGRRHRASAPDQ